MCLIIYIIICIYLKRLGMNSWKNYICYFIWTVIYWISYFVAADLPLVFEYDYLNKFWVRQFIDSLVSLYILVMGYEILYKFPRPKRLLWTVIAWIGFYWVLYVSYLPLILENKSLSDFWIRHSIVSMVIFMYSLLVCYVSFYKFPKPNRMLLSGLFSLMRAGFYMGMILVYNTLIHHYLPQGLLHFLSDYFLVIG